MYFCVLAVFFMKNITPFLEYLLLEKKYSKHTITSYKTDLDGFAKFISDEFEVTVLCNVNYNQIRSYIVYLSELELSPKTINRKITALKSFYKFLLKINLITENPLVKHKSLKIPKRVNIAFTDAEISKVLELDFCADDFISLRNTLIIEILYVTGMRREELINLKISDIDFKQGILKVLGKRNKERYIPLLKTVQNKLKSYIAVRNEMLSNTDKLFITKKGEKIYGTLVYRIINSYFSAVSTKVKKSPHVLRHAFATHLLNEGADLNAVKELLGHTSLASTQVYVSSSLKKLKKMYNQAHPRSNKNK